MWIVVQPRQVDTLWNHHTVSLTAVAVGRSPQPSTLIRVAWATSHHGTKQRAVCNIFYGLVLKVTYHHFCIFYLLWVGQLDQNTLKGKMSRPYLFQKELSKNLRTYFTEQLCLSGSNSKRQSRLLQEEVTARSSEELDACRTLPQGQCGQSFMGKPWEEEPNLRPSLHYHHMKFVFYSKCNNKLFFSVKKSNAVWFAFLKYCWVHCVGTGL